MKPLIRWCSTFIAKWKPDLRCLPAFERRNWGCCSICRIHSSGRRLCWLDTG